MHKAIHLALSDADIQTIGESIATLPGRWYLDPLIDERRHGKPRVGIRADELTDHHVDAIGIERSIGLILVTICRDDEDEHAALPNLVYETLERAIVCLRIYLDSVSKLTWRIGLAAKSYDDISNPDGALRPMTLCTQQPSRVA